MVRGILGSLLLLLFSTANAATTIDLYTAELVVEPQGRVRGSVTLLLNLTSPAPVTLRLPPVSELRLSDSGAPLPFETLPGAIRFTPRAAGPHSSVRLEMATDEPTSKAGGTWNISFPIGADRPIREDRVRLQLPKGAVLQGFSPAARVGVKESIRLEWSPGPVPSNGQLSLSASYRIEAPEPPSPPWEALGLFAAATTTGFLGGRTLRRRIRVPSSPHPPTQQVPLVPSEGQKTVLQTLTPPEREVLEALLKAGGRTTQAELRTETGLPKSTLSRTLHGLRGRQLVELRNIGHTNLVLLTEWFLKK